VGYRGLDATDKVEGRKRAGGAIRTKSAADLRREKVGTSNRPGNGL
jgi:hypothetical protein